MLCVTIQSGIFLKEGDEKVLDVFERADVAMYKNKRMLKR